ncbi:DUF2304 domain-containing protein [Microbacterium sp. NPDC058021]|uniref:DUF2304 domain-containing protein n=1 Tax=Microbacterium sp. NPDC058021 TaxID=3346306 RepID=UPI0036DAD611
MSTATYILGIIAAAGAFVYIVDLLRRGRLRERHAVLWLFAALAALIVSIAPGILVSAADALGVDVPANLMFFVAIVVLFLVSIQHSTELTKIEEQNRKLVETVALLEMRLGARDDTTLQDDDAH